MYRMSLASAQNAWLSTNSASAPAVGVGATGDNLRLVGVVSSSVTAVPLTVATDVKLFGADGLKFTTSDVAQDVSINFCVSLLNSGTTPEAGTVVFKLVDVTVPASPVDIVTSATYNLTATASSASCSGVGAILNVAPGTEVAIQLVGTATTTTTAGAVGAGCVVFSYDH